MNLSLFMFFKRLLKIFLSPTNEILLLLSTWKIYFLMYDNLNIILEFCGSFFFKIT